MDYPKITVVTPSYNQGEFIERTILSVINQSYPNLEYIICDGGSTDNTIDVIKKYENKISCWISEKDKGQTDAINKGMRLATGDIVCWINSDDVLLPGTLSRVGTIFKTCIEMDILMGLVIEIDKDDRVVKLTHTIINRWFVKHGCYNILQQGMFWKRKLFDQIGYLNDKFHACMDLEFVIRSMVNNAKIKIVNIPLGAIRIHENTKTAIGGDIWEKDRLKLIEMYNGAYVWNRRKYYYWLYVLLKLIRGYYFSDFYYKFTKSGRKYFDIHMK